MGLELCREGRGRGDLAWMDRWSVTGVFNLVVCVCPLRGAIKCSERVLGGLIGYICTDTYCIVWEFSI